MIVIILRWEQSKAKYPRAKVNHQLWMYWVRPILLRKILKDEKYGPTTAYLVKMMHHLVLDSTFLTLFRGSLVEEQRVNHLLAHHQNHLLS